MTQVIKMKRKIIHEEIMGEDADVYAFFENLNQIDFRDDLSYK